jgi:hypothetical protein
LSLFVEPKNSQSEFFLKFISEIFDSAILSPELLFEKQNFYQKLSDNENLAV